MRSFAKSLMSHYVVLLILFFCFFLTYTKFWFLYHLFSLFTNFVHLQLSHFSLISIFSFIIFEISLRFFKSLAFDFLPTCFVISVFISLLYFSVFLETCRKKGTSCQHFLGQFILLTDYNFLRLYMQSSILISWSSSWYNFGYFYPQNLYFHIFLFFTLFENHNV